MSNSKMTYVAIGVETDGCDDIYYILQNPVETRRILKSDLKKAIKNDIFDVVNLNKLTWEITYDYPQKYLFLQDACFHLRACNLSDSVLVSIIQYLDILNSMNSLNKCDFDFVQDLLRLLSRYFNYLRDTDVFFCKEKFSKMLLWRKSVQPSMYNSHSSIVNLLVDNSRVSKHRNSILGWFERAENSPVSYSIFVSIMSDLWIQNNSFVEKEIIKHCLLLLRDCLFNSYYSEVGIYLYEEYMLRLSDCFVNSLNSPFGIMLSSKLDVPEFTDKTRKEFLKGCLNETEEKVYDYIKRKDNSLRNLNYTVSKYGSEAMSVLTSCVPEDYMKDDISKLTYKEWLSESVNRVTYLFNLTIKKIKENSSAMGEISKAHKFVADASNFINIITNDPITKFISKSSGLSQQWYSHNTFLNSIVSANSKVKATRETKKCLNDLKSLDSISLAVVLYKINKLVYLATPDAQKPSVHFVTFGCDADLMPMLNLTTKCKDYRDFPIFEPYSIYELDESLYGIGKGNYIDSGSHNPIDILWCSMLYMVYKRLDVKRTKFKDESADIAFSVFMDLYFSDTLSHPESSLHRIEAYLKFERGWKITRKINDMDWFMDILHKLSVPRKKSEVQSVEEISSYKRDFSSWK